MTVSLNYTKSDSNLSRRSFLTAATGVAGLALFRPEWLHAASAAAPNDGEVDPRVEQVKRMTISIDMHNHVFSGTAGLGAASGGSSTMNEPNAGPPLLLADQFKQAGMTAVVAGYKIPFDPNAQP